jgi:hypothetical protein
MTANTEMMVPTVCLPAIAWLEAAASLEKCELWVRCLQSEGDEGQVRAGLERLCAQAWQQLGQLMPTALELARAASAEGQRCRIRGLGS